MKWVIIIVVLLEIHIKSYFHRNSHIYLHITWSTSYPSKRLVVIIFYVCIRTFHVLPLVNHVPFLIVRDQCWWWWRHQSIIVEHPFMVSAKLGMVSCSIGQLIYDRFELGILSQFLLNYDMIRKLWLRYGGPCQFTHVGSSGQRINCDVKAIFFIFDNKFKPHQSNKLLVILGVNILLFKKIFKTIVIHLNGERS